MPCKIQIKQHVTDLVVDKSNPGLSMSLQNATELAAAINMEFQHHVVSFYNDQGSVSRSINIPSELVNEYFDDQLKNESIQSAQSQGLVTLDRTGKVFNQELQSKLVNFLNGLKITTEFNADELLKSLDFKSQPLAAFDQLQKFLAFSSGNENLMPNQVANIMYSFLGKKSSLSKALWLNIKQWESYDTYYDQYVKTVNINSQEDEDFLDEFEEELNIGNFNPFAHKMVIVKFLEQSLYEIQKGETPVTKRINEDIDAEFFKKRGRMNIYEGNLLQRLFAKLFNFFKTLISGPVFQKYNPQDLIDLGLDIAEDVLKNDYKKFIRGIVEKDGVLYTDSGKQLELKDYNDTLNKDDFAKSIVDKLVTAPYIKFKLSGSLTLRKFGKLFRDIFEDVHDIDGVITLETFLEDPLAFKFKTWVQTKGLALINAKKNKAFFKEVAPKIQQLNWYKNLKQIYPDFVMTNAFIGKDHKKGESITISGYVNHPTEKVIDEKTGKEIPKKYVLDFFLRIDEGNYPEIFDNYWKDWKQIFEAKLKMGRSKDLTDLIYFDPFINDKFKFTNKGYRYFSFVDNNLKDEIETVNENLLSEFEMNLNNLNLTPEVVSYLYASSRFKSLGKSLNDYNTEANRLINNLQASFSKEQILEKLKCL